MNEFYSRVYKLVSQIPKGKVTTYGQIAILLGKPQGGARMVGRAMRVAPAELHLPCHRVVNRLGEMAPSYAFGSQDVQKQLLISEGITFNKDGNINTKEHLWNYSNK